MDLNDKNYEPVCPDCGLPMRSVIENVGFSEPYGPTKDEVVGYYCSNCGHKEPTT